MFHERSIHELKTFQRKKWTIHIYVLKFLLMVIRKLLTLYLLGCWKVGRSSKTHETGLLYNHFTERIPFSHQAKPYKRCVVCYKRMGKGNTTQVLGQWSQNLCRKLLQSLPRWSQLLSEYFLFCHLKTSCIIIIDQNFYTSAWFPSRDKTFYIQPSQILVQREVGYLNWGIIPTWGDNMCHQVF